jgi:hypothetical protein
MRKGWVVGFVSLLLVGCGEQAELEKLVKSQLRDPESAKFKDFIVSDKKTRACLIFNAKNGFGGYGSWSVAEFQKSADVWEVKSLKGDEENCSSMGFKALDTKEQVSADSKFEFIRLIAKLNAIPEDDASKIAQEKDCASLATSYKWTMGRLAEFRIRGNDGMIKYLEKDLQDTLQRFNTSTACKVK